MNESRPSRKSGLVPVLIFAYFASAALSMKLAQPNFPDSYKINAVSEVLWNLRYSLVHTSGKSTLLFICFAWMGQWVESKKTDSIRAIPMASFLISLIWLLGGSYRIDNTALHLYASWGQVIKSVVYVIGTTWMIHQGMYLLYWVIDQAQPAAPILTKTNIQAFVAKHTFAIPMLLLIVCWLPHILISYPANMCVDAWNQLLQFLGVYDFTAHHPPAHTVLMGWIVQLGGLLKDGEFGLFLVVVLQAVCGAAVMAYAIHTMAKLAAPRPLIVLALMAGILVPYCSAYVTLLLKDNLYSYAFLLFMTEMVCLLMMEGQFFRSARHVFLLFLSITGVLLLRNNGKYILYPFFAIILVYDTIRFPKTRERRRYILQLFLAMLIPVLCASWINLALTGKYDIAPGSIREALSLPFQQTARYVAAYPDEITEEEEAAISAVLDFDHMAENYNPRISDPVKNTYQETAKAGDLVRYLKVWVRMFFKHPMVYFHATLNQNYYLVYPGLENNTLYTGTYLERFLDVYPETELFQDAALRDQTEAQLADNGFQALMFSLPVVGALSSPAICNLILIAMLIFAVHTKKPQWLLASVPPVLNNLGILLAPVIQYHPRYVFPVIFSMPILIAFYCYLNNPDKPLTS